MSEGAVKKEERRKFQAVKGTRDILPPETALWSRVEQAVGQVFGTYGYGEIRLPVFEATELFARAVGGETDIVAKEMYSFEDHESNELAALKTLLLAKQSAISDANFLRSYELKAAEFRERLRIAMESGEVSKTPENEKVLKDLRPIVDALALHRQKHEETKDARIFEQLRHNAGAIRNHLLAVDLGDKLSLRPEATASVCRAYIEHNMQQLPQPVKLYYLGPMFRRERPQKGRYRQFYQIGAEVLGGTDAPAIDAEVIEMVMTLFDKLGLQGVQLDINSIGCRNCRSEYVALLRTELRRVQDNLGPDSQRRIETNPLRVLDSKVASEQPIIAKLPRIADHLCEDCRVHYAAVKRELDLRDVKYQENWRLVRGLDYYMRTTFEITAPGLGSQNAVCGGGRYDGLVELLGGPPTKGIGFAIGEDRLILSLQQEKAQQALLVYIAWMGEKTYATAVRAAKQLRSAGFSVELPPVEQKIGKALGQADKLGARYALILGENEVSSGEWTLKTLASGEQAKLTKADLLSYLRVRVNRW